MYSKLRMIMHSEGTLDKSEEPETAVFTAACQHETVFGRPERQSVDC
jgi:hypothetical protein